MKILITGSRGFIGSSVGNYAASLGHRVLGTGRAKTCGSQWSADYVQTEASPERFTQIVTSFEPDVVLHAAGSASVGQSVANPISDLHDSSLTSAYLLEGVRLSGIKPLIILPSSAAVLGNPEELPVKESAAVKPISPYGFHKAVTELLAREYAECFDLEIVVLRLFSVFGSAQRRLLVLELYQQLIGPNNIVWLAGSGSESRDFLYIDDVCLAILGLIENRSTDRFLLVNVASGVETNVTALATELRNLVSPQKEIACRGDHRRSDPVRWWADVSQLTELLGSWKPRSLSEGLSQCIAKWQQRGFNNTGHGHGC